MFNYINLLKTKTKKIRLFFTHFDQYLFSTLRYHISYPCNEWVPPIQIYKRTKYETKKLEALEKQDSLHY